MHEKLIYIPLKLNRIMSLVRFYPLASYIYIPLKLNRIRYNTFVGKNEVIKIYIPLKLNRIGRLPAVYPRY